MSQITYVYCIVVTYPADDHGKILPPNNAGERVQIAEDEWINPGWPVNRLYLSKSAADGRAKLFRKLGAEAEVVRSRQVLWPQKVTFEP